MKGSRGKTGNTGRSVALVLAALLGMTRSALGQPAPAANRSDVTTEPPRDSWSRALDALVAGDLDAAQSAATLTAADPSASAERRDEARGLVERIRKRRSPSAATVPAPAAPDSSPPSPATESDASDERGGRTFLVGTSTLSGLALWGWTVPVALDIQNQRGAIGLYMLTAGASFGVPFLLTRHGPATWGMADMAWFGSTRGALAGFGVGTLIAGDSGSDQGRAGSALLGSVLGNLGATLYAREAHLTPGNANLIGLASDVGALLGLAAAHITGLDQRSEDPATRNSDRGARMLAGFGLGGGAAGFVAGRYLGTRGAFTWGDAEVLRLPIALGVTGAAMIMDWEGTDSTRAVVGALSLGGLGGAVLGDRLVRERDFGVGQAFLLDLGTVAGALTAMGTVYLLTGSNDSRTYLTSAFAGGGAAFAALYLNLEAPPARALAARLSPRGKAPSLSLMPYATPANGSLTRGLALAGNF